MDTRRTLSIIAQGAADTQRLSRISSTSLSLNDEFELDGLDNSSNRVIFFCFFLKSHSKLKYFLS